MHANNSNSTAQNDAVASSVTGGATEDDEAMAQASLLVDSVMLPMTLQAAIDLGLLDTLAGAQLTVAEVAAKLPAKENPQAADMVERIFRLLAAFSVVNCSVDGGETAARRVYGLTAVGRYFVKNEDGVSMAPVLSYKIKDAVLDGGNAFNKVHGMNAFEYPATDPKFNQVFNLAMFNHTTILMKKILRSYNGFENVDGLVDVGGGLGHTLKIILTKYPNIKAINFDLPHVIIHGLSHPGMEHVGGDMFEVVPSVEAIFMKVWILHDWSDEQCLKLLRNCCKAIPENGKVIVVESVVSDEPETSTATKAITMMDMVMMTQNPGGKERTKTELLALAKAAGFGGIRFACNVANFWVMEFYK
ncbi:hypothetical protein V2J09_008499 [Rumex salicifolius]